MLIKYLLNGKEINLTSDNTTINSSNFSVDKQGNMQCNNANITGGKIELYSETTAVQPSIKIINPYQNTTYVDITSGVLRAYGNGDLSTQFYYNIGSLVLYATDGVRSIHTGGYSTYRNSSDKDTITLNASDGKIQCISLYQTSLEQQKKNFQKMQDNALDIIKSIDIYRYNLKSEKDTDKKHLGFVIGDDYNYSKEVTSIDNQGVDNYSFTSLCCKAIQELAEQNQQLQKRIEVLEKEAKNG